MDIVEELSFLGREPGTRLTDPGLCVGFWAEL